METAADTNVRTGVKPAIRLDKLEMISNGRDELLTISEMAARLKVPLSWLYSRTRIKGTEAMPGVLRCGKYLRFEPQIVLDYIKKKYSDERG